MHTPDLDFIVVGLPRSGTTWIANWLTTDRTFCLHDPFAQGMPEDWPIDGRKLGISCTVSGLLNGWLERFNCPLAIIDRPAAERNASLHRMGFSDQPYEGNFDKLAGRRFAYDDLWDEERAKSLWRHLLPDEAFDALRYRQLVRMQVQPHPSHWTMDMSVIQSLKNHGYLRTR